MPASTLFPFNTNTEFLAGRPAAISSSSCRGSKMPIVTTLHTVLAKPTPAQHDVMRRIIDISAKIVVMSEKGRELLRSVHDVPARKIEIIPHGIPDFPFRETHHAKAKFGFCGKDRHSDVRSSVAEQGHRDHDRCHAGDHQILPERRLCHSRRNPSEPCAASGRGLSRELDGARAGSSASRTMSSSSTSSSTRPRCWTSFRCATSM